MDCRCGRRHWGLHGAAGLLLVRPDADGRPGDLVLQHRAVWSDQGGTWGLPGGARQPGESAEDAALRESAEEAGIDPADVEPLATWVLDHRDWSYTTVVARTRGPVEPAVTDAESLEVSWVPQAELTSRALLPAFEAAWPELASLLLQHWR